MGESSIFTINFHKMDIGLTGFIRNLPLQTFRLLQHNEISDGVFEIAFKRQHAFLPGQVVAISLDHSIAPRLYSICSGSSESLIHVLFNVKHDGLLSPQLAMMKVGDSLMVSPPFGAFLGDERPAWWIASGTGIAPFRSMIRSGLGKSKTLIHGGRTLNSFYYSEEMLKHADFHYVRCCSQESGEGVYSGRLTNWLRHQDLPQNNMFYLCGSAEMVVEVRDILINKGVDIQQIMSEIYF